MEQRPESPDAYQSGDLKDIIGDGDVNAMRELPEFKHLREQMHALGATNEEYQKAERAMAEGRAAMFHVDREAEVKALGDRGEARFKEAESFVSTLPEELQAVGQALASTSGGVKLLEHLQGSKAKVYADGGRGAPQSEAAIREQIDKLSDERFAIRNDPTKRNAGGTCTTRSTVSEGSCKHAAPPEALDAGGWHSERFSWPPPPTSMKPSSSSSRPTSTS